MWGRNPPSHKVKGSHPRTAHQPKPDPAVAVKPDKRQGFWFLTRRSTRWSHGSRWLPGMEAGVTKPTPTPFQHLSPKPRSFACSPHHVGEMWWARDTKADAVARREQQMGNPSCRTRTHSQDSTVLLQILYRVGSKRAGVTERNEVNQRASSLPPRLFIAEMTLGGAAFLPGNSGRAQAAVTFLHLWFRALLLIAWASLPVRKG